MANGRLFAVVNFLDPWSFHLKMETGVTLNNEQALRLARNIQELAKSPRYPRQKIEGRVTTVIMTRHEGRRWRRVELDSGVSLWQEDNNDNGLSQAKAGDEIIYQITRVERIVTRQTLKINGEEVSLNFF